MLAHGPLFERISGKMRVWRNRKLEKARRLMEKNGLSLKEKIERDKLVEWLGRKGGWKGNAFLKAWAMLGDVGLRPDPDVLGRAIANGGEDSEHLHGIAHCSLAKELDFNTRYYFARLLAAECGALAENGSILDPRKSITYFICSGAEKMVRFIRETEPELVREFEKERRM